MFEYIMKKCCVFFFQAEDGIRDADVTGVQTCALPISLDRVTDADLVVDLHWTLAQCRVIAGRSQESLDALTSALAGPDLGAKHRARLLVLTGRMHRDVGQVEKAYRVATEALAAGTKIHDEWTIGWALHVLILVAM